MPYTLRKSAVEPLFFELHDGSAVAREVSIPFPLPKHVPSFSTEEEAMLWVQSAERAWAKRYLLRILSMRASSRHLLLQKLRKRHISDGVALDLVDEMERLGLLSDSDFYDALVRKLIRQGYGPLYIEKKLSLCGGKAPVISASLLQEALQKALSKMKGKAPKQRVAALLRRGFSWEMIQSHGHCRFGDSF